jgi:hypothetical protein
MCKFRVLNADEIECRVARCTENGAQLLLYKDARCDMNILDETVGANNWQRQHMEHRGNLFCAVGIKENGEWVWKEDAGAESNTEAEKGHASDSFKRACVNWGIGRELYTSPFIWVSGVSVQDRGKWVCRETFTVKAITYDDKRKINGLTIVDKSGNVVYQMGKPAPETKPCTCKRCGNEIKAKKCGGKVYTPAEIAENATKKYQVPLCWSCMSLLKENSGE